MHIPRPPAIKVCVLTFVLKKIVYITKVSALHRLWEVGSISISIANNHCTQHTVSCNKLASHNKITRIVGSAK